MADKCWYVSGPMRGKSDFNYPSFNAVAEWLREAGAEVSNPAESFDGDTNRPLRDYLQQDVVSLCRCTDIVFLPGWQNSAGARIEYLIADALGMEMHQAFFMADEVDCLMGMIDNDLPIELLAGKIVRNGARQQTYGHPAYDLGRSAEMWDVLGFGTQDQPEKVALAMIAVKMSRLVTTPAHRDSLLDIIGYAICMDRILREPLE